MDFSTRNNSQPQTVAPTAHAAAPANTTVNNRKYQPKEPNGKWFKLSVAGLLAYLLAVVILVVGVLVALGLDQPKPESSYVNTSKLQAVFLNTGQVYFGNLKKVNSTYFILQNIYYLQTSSASGSTSTSSSNTSVSLVKLGCELHAPYDQMIINSSQVTFWENLQSTGQVAKAVATFEQKNPNGQQCSDQSTSANTNGTSSVQGATANSSATTGTSSTTK